MVAEEDVHEVEPFDDGGVGDAELLFDVADFALAAEEDHDELLQVGGQPEERGNGQRGLDGGVAVGAGEAADFEFAFAEGASGDELLGGLGAHVIYCIN